MSRKVLRLGYLLFNFSASYTGGGYKRVYEYVKAFNSTSGAQFILHPRCRYLANEFPNNTYYFVEQSIIKRMLIDCEYLCDIVARNGKPDFYYSYGIPIYSKIARINWFHLSNVLPIAPRGIPMSAFDHIKMRFLGSRIRRNLSNADVISAESNFSLGLLGAVEKAKLFLSVNGSDDELELLKKGSWKSKIDIAVVLGTYRYKAIADSFRVFEMLRNINCSSLKLVIIGPPEQIPKEVTSNANVVVKGILSRADVLNILGVARFYISTTYIENSYNAASEGIFSAEESYISDIGPHRELMIGMPYELVTIPGIPRSILHIEKKNINGANIKSWEYVISEMLVKVQELLHERTDGAADVSKRDA